MGTTEQVETTEYNESCKTIRDWTPVSDVFALRYFPIMTSVSGIAAGAYINRHYRKALRLRNHAFISTLLPVVVLPSLAGAIVHDVFVQRPLITGEIKCPVCLEVRGGVLQAFCGFFYPLVLAPAAALSFSTRYHTYYMPEINKDPKAVMKELWKLTKPVWNKFYLIAAAQFILGMGWTHMEVHNLFTLAEKIAAMEDKLKAHREQEEEKRQLQETGYVLP